MVIDALFRAFVPPPRLRLSEWIEREIRLPAGLSATPGPIKLWPWQRDIADSIGNPEVERVSFLKATRLGFTSLTVAAIGNFARNEPSAVLCLLPTQDDARDFVVADLETVFAASPVLSDTMSDAADETGRSTLLHRRFAGGSLKVVAARAPRNLRRHTARILIADEIDAFEVGAEGNPLKLAERRTLSFADRKIIVGSTPIFEDTSLILRAYAESDGRVYECPCPACGAFNEILWRHIIWKPDQPETAQYRCPHCEALIDERHKPAMVAAGRWRATRPEIAGHHGYWLNSLISLLPNAAWPKLAAEFVAAGDNPSELQVFANTILGEAWREAGAEIDEASLAGRGEPFSLEKIPREVLLVVCGVDVQDDRLEIVFVGFTGGAEIFVLAYETIWGTPDDDATWVQLDEYLRRRWRHPLGGQIGVDAAAVDSGDGEFTDRVYRFCFPRAGRRVMAVKGVGGTRPAIQVSKGKISLRSGTGTGRLWIVGVDGIKTQIFSRLQRGQLMRFSDALEPVFYEQLCSERRVVRYSKGRPVRRFERISGKRAEALDALVYAIAARSAVSLHVEQREQALRRSPMADRPTRLAGAGNLDDLGVGKVNVVEEVYRRR